MLKRFEGNHHSAGRPPQLFAFLREADSGRGTAEQGRSNMSFELPQPPTQCRRAHSKFLRGAVYAPGSSDREKKSK